MNVIITIRNKIPGDKGELLEKILEEILEMECVNEAYLTSNNLFLVIEQESLDDLSELKMRLCSLNIAITSTEMVMETLKRDGRRLPRLKKEAIIEKPMFPTATPQSEHLTHSTSDLDS